MMFNRLPVLIHREPCQLPITTYHPTYQDWWPCWAQRESYHVGGSSPTHLSCDMTDHTVNRAREAPPLPHGWWGSCPFHHVCVLSWVSHRSYPLWTQTYDHSKQYCDHMFGSSKVQPVPRQTHYNEWKELGVTRSV